ncbi:HAMP domain-containing sensor histidine kinase [Promicromonospora xylanilytica]
MRFGGRLVVSMTLVMLCGVLVAWLVAQAVGPGVFRDHMERASHEPGSVAAHALEAFVSASTATLAAALGAAVATSLLAGFLVSRRVASSLRNTATVAAQVSAGRFDVRVMPPGIGSEFDDLAGAINAMAQRLGRNDAMRRRLMADIAHELRTPVATISAYLDALDDGVEVLSPATTEVLQAQASRLTRLADDLGAVMRAESGAMVLDLVPVDAYELIEVCAESLRPRYERSGVALVTDVRPGTPRILADRDRMGQVLGNLVDNALRHTPAGGTVRLTAELHGAVVRFAVADTGDGIEAEHLPYVFERFYRVDVARDRGHGGSGIGLAIVRALVLAHGGTVSVLSPGKSMGTTFVVDLPVRPDGPRWHPFSRGH